MAERLVQEATYIMYDRVEVAEQQLRDAASVHVAVGEHAKSIVRVTRFRPVHHVDDEVAAISVRLYGGLHGHGAAGGHNRESVMLSSVTRTRQFCYKVETGV